jgi:type III secretion protein L
MTRIIRGRSVDSQAGRRPNPERPRRVTSARLEAEAAARIIIDKARAERDAILARGRAEAESLRERSREEGRAEAAGILLAVQKRSHETEQRSVHDLTSLAAKIAERILGAQLKVAKESVNQIVSQCLKSNAGARQIVMRVHPDDLPIVEQAIPRMKSESDIELLFARADPSIAPGGCVLETELGEIDGRLQTQLQAIKEALTR